MNKIKTLKVVSKEPWGTFTEDGQINGNEVSLTADDPSLAKSLAQVINQWTMQHTIDMGRGSFRSDMKFLARDGWEYSYFSHLPTFSKLQATYLGLNYDPSSLSLIQFRASSAIGMEITDSESYHIPYNDQLNHVFYMEYDKAKQQWLIYAFFDGTKQIDAGPPYVHLDPPSQQKGDTA